ncbi:hypothetical protein BH11MYX1_BH11MYX1_44160 [soil metagenome]
MMVAVVSRVQLLRRGCKTLSTLACVMWSTTFANAQPARPQTVAPPADPQPQRAFYDPIDSSGWPIGRSLDDLRELPECGIEGISHVPGAPLTCRPRLSAGGAQWGLGFDWTSGGTFGDVPTIGGAQGLGVEFDLAVLRSIELGLRYELLGIGLPATSRFEASTSASNQFLAQAKWRLFTDEVGRAAWTFGVGGGYALRGDDLGGSAPLVRGSLARELGMYLDNRGAMTCALELAYERSLGTTQVSAVLASLRLGFELGIREPLVLGRRAPSEWRHTTTFETYASAFTGFGFGLGLPITPSLSLETTGRLLFGLTRDVKLHGLDGFSWSLESGPRLLLGWPAQLPLYLQAQAGAAWVSQAPRGEVHVVGTGELGFHARLPCSSAVEVGGWLRANLDGGFEAIAGGLVLRLIVGAGNGGAGGHGEGECGRGIPHLAVPYEPPPPTTTTTSHPDAVDLDPLRIAVPNVGVQVGGTIEVPQPQPIVLEVDLGAVLFGVQVRIDPRLLPFDRLRGAGWITVELSGPADAVLQFQGPLSATLSRGNVRVDGWTSVASDSSLVHARFTIWPPGTHP